jgi:6-phosphogluconolactonase (cycloisomerase 2 family)
LSDNETDSIAHFKISKADRLSDFRVEFKDTVSSGGILLRQMNFGKDGNFIYVSNQAGNQGIILFRANVEGSLVAKPRVSFR